MLRNLLILGLLALVVALPFAFRREPPAGAWREGDPVLVIVTPHNEAIRYEMARGFSLWHQKQFGQPVRIDWRNVGGTTEISRYLASQYANSARAWWLSQNRPWPDGATDALTLSRPPSDPKLLEIFNAYRAVDDPDAISSGIDLFFGGGEFDHANAFRSGFTVNIRAELPPELFADGTQTLIPDRQSGETWVTDHLFGNVVSTFGIVYNPDRIASLGINEAPDAWSDLADFRYFGAVGLADPTKSGSIAKAFEMLIHQAMHDALRDAGFSNDQIADAEKRIAEHQKGLGAEARRWSVPSDLESYQRALEQGWVAGVNLVRRIAANARYFTDSAGKVPIDVSMGDCAAGMAIDFFGRYQAQVSIRPDGRETMRYVTPVGGTSVSCDPISVLRGAPSRELALRFVQFVLSEEGQKLWTYLPGAPGGPEKYALRRLPIRRDFYPSADPAMQTRHLRHARYAGDDLADPTINPYALAEQFIYYRRWTGDHFSVQRDLIRAMSLDSAVELKQAWRHLNEHGGDTRVFDAMPTVKLRNAQGEVSEVELNWRTAPDIRRGYDTIEYMREWTKAFRENYRTVAGR
jgi:ABC-type Fe3+ transport system substrate-binding protein